MKYVVLLEFNGHLFVPLEIVVYDHTLQCISENVIYKCANITSLDYGYFKDSNSKSKQLVIRNWNPESKNVQLTLPADAIAMYGINATMKLYSPLPTYEPPLRTTPHAVEFLLRGQQFVIVSLEIELLQNATSAALPLQILSSTENIITMLRVRVENGTIALIPQIIRLRNAFGRTVDYLNLVSTFSEKYRISNISTNHSCLTVHANNHSHIQ